MANQDKLAKAQGVLDALTAEQKKLVLESKSTEKALFSKLNEMGAGLDEKQFTEVLAAAAIVKEGEVFDQEVALDELEAVAGGVQVDSDRDNCSWVWKRNIYGGNGFANCAATVEDGSWCDTNDACHDMAIVYTNIKGCYFSDCSKAWH